jgi:hypothetical protein
MPTKLNTEILAAAITGFEEQKKRIDAHIAELRQMLSPSATDGTAPAAKGRRRMSAAPVPKSQQPNGRDGPSPESNLERLR